MNVLFVVAYAPNPVRVRPYQFIRTLLSRGNQVTVATLWTSEEEKSDLAHLGELGVEVIATGIARIRTVQNLAHAVLQGSSLQSHWSWEPSLFGKLCDVLTERKYDVIHVEHLRGSRYALALQGFIETGKARGRPPVVWDSVDAITALFEQARRLAPGLKTKLMTTVDQARTRRDEGMLASSFARVVVTSERDGEVLVRLATECSPERGAAARATLRVIANGVDSTVFSFAGMDTREPATLVFSGKMSYHANAATARFLVNEIMPLVWQSKPETCLWIVGKDPGQEMLDWTKRYPGKIVVTGAVPDMGLVLGKATLAVAPLVYGAGIQNKVLEAMACGTPVLASPLAVSALQIEPGVDLEIADGAATFAQAICNLLDDPAKREQMGRAGRAYVENKHSWNAATAALEQVYREAVQASAATTP